ncbi:MAG TPA: hypothetical protein VMV05_05255, partial [bacterium]|nr:hypothetical protein [bacterium]
WDNVKAGFTILARFFSLVCSEIPRFIGVNNSSRWAFLNHHLWLWIPGVVLWYGGYLQAVAMLVFLFVPRHPIPRWNTTRAFIVLSFLLVWASFWFTNKLPLAHIYLNFYPWLMLYSCYCWAYFADKPWGAWVAKAFVIFGLYFMLGHAWTHPPEFSVLSQRDKIQQAIHQKDYRLLGERIPGSLY